MLGPRVLVRVRANYWPFGRRSPRFPGHAIARSMHLHRGRPIPTLARWPRCDTGHGFGFIASIV